MTADRLEVCRDCDRHVWSHETECPHCGSNLAEAEARWQEDSLRRQALIAEVQRWAAEGAGEAADPVP